MAAVWNEELDRVPIRELDIYDAIMLRFTGTGGGLDLVELVSIGMHEIGRSGRTLI